MPTYEMLWDCSSCGTPKLLGKTHRRCPHCGAPQDPTKRYFPPVGQEVPVEGHVFVGADWKCAACETPNSRAADFCVSCGNPRDGNAAVKQLGDQIVKGGQIVDDGLPKDPKRAVGTSVPAPPGAARSRVPFVVGGVIAALVAFLLVAIFWQKDVTVVVERHDWTREIDIEKMAPRSDSAWCDSMPGDAYSVRHSREVRSHRQIPDGQECHDRRHDNGDGTFSTSTECRTKYRSEPVYDDKCYYTVNRWGVDRTAKATGVNVTPEPSWPVVRVSGGSCLGCEREGPRRESLNVDLRGSSARDKTWRCTLDTGRWRALRDGDVRPMKVRVIGGGAVCDTLKP